LATGLVLTLTGEPAPVHRRRVRPGPVAALLGGATVGALVLRVAPLWARALPATLVAAVVAVTAVLNRGRMEAS
jgi:hypothetical protein